VYKLGKICGEATRIKCGGEDGENLVFHDKRSGRTEIYPPQSGEFFNTQKKFVSLSTTNGERGSPAPQGKKTAAYRETSMVYEKPQGGSTCMRTPRYLVVGAPIVWLVDTKQ